jgi:xanthosine utilization system XapX-like protein
LSRFGPTRGELKFRLVFSLGGLVMTLVALFAHGIPSAPALVEVLGIAGLFFGGTAVWSARRLMRRDD